MPLAGLSLLCPRIISSIQQNRMQDPSSSEQQNAVQYKVRAKDTHKQRTTTTKRHAKHSKKRHRIKPEKPAINHSHQQWYEQGSTEEY